VESITERLSLYQRLDNCETEAELQQMAGEMQDRFGPVPQQMKDLFITVRCRKLAVDLGFEKISLKDEIARCYFINKHDSPFYESEAFRQILLFLQTMTNQARLKQTGRTFFMIIDKMAGMEELHRFLVALHKFCFQKENLIA
jgi:transcription-repair coupling factor (superfamily II helicase)